MNPDLCTGSEAGTGVAGNDANTSFLVVFVSRIFFAALGLLVSFLALAQDFPSKPIRLIVSGGAGSSTDIVARVLAPELGKSLGQPVVAENRPGGGQIIAVESVLSQPADGYVLIVISIDVLATMPVTEKALRFDPLKDLPPITGVVEAKWILGSSSQLPWKSFGELVDGVRANPGKYNWGYTVALTRLLTEVILRDKGLVATGIPYAGGGGVYDQAALSGSEVQFTLTAESFAAQFSDRFRVFAITGRQRSPGMPAVPTFAELGYPQIHGLLWTLNARNGTPTAVLERLAAATSRVLQLPEIKARYAKFHFEIAQQGTPAAAQALTERAKVFAVVAKQIGFQPQ